VDSCTSLCRLHWLLFSKHENVIIKLANTDIIASTKITVLKVKPMSVVLVHVLV